MERKIKSLWTDETHLAFYNDGTMSVSDGVGYVGELSTEETKELYETMKKFYETNEVCYVRM